MNKDQFFLFVKHVFFEFEATNLKIDDEIEEL